MYFPYFQTCIMKFKKFILPCLIVCVLLSCMKADNEPRTEVGTLVTQPGNDIGQDALVLGRAGDTDGANVNHGSHGELNYSRWTYGAQGFGEGSMQSYIKFTELSIIPEDAEIISAHLSLFGVSSTTPSYMPQGNSHYPGSTYNSESSDNKGWVKRVTANWDEATITWANKPGVSEEYKVEIPATTSQWDFNVTNLDVTELVQIMVSTKTNYGFWLGLQQEALYKNVNFSSSEATDPTKRPKLVVVYKYTVDD